MEGGSVSILQSNHGCQSAEEVGQSAERWAQQLEAGMGKVGKCPLEEGRGKPSHQRTCRHSGGVGSEAGTTDMVQLIFITPYLPFYHQAFTNYKSIAL